jgi:hypothetical protein
MVYQSFKRLCACVGLIILVVACGDEKSDLAADDMGLAAASIEGQWDSGCIAAGDQYESKSITFTEKSFDFNSIVYTDAICKTVSDRIDAHGEFLLSGPVVVPYVGTTTAIDYTFFTYTWKFVANPSDAVDYGAACGKAAVSGGSVNVLGKACELSDTGTINFFSPAYGVVFVDAKGKLLITDASSNSGAKEDRSTSLRIDAGWTKATAPSDVTP